jgi:uracil-DNA glycosylase
VPDNSHHDPVAGANPAAAVAALASTIRNCRICRDQPTRGPALAQEPRPILRVNTKARLLIASQAPGIRAHNSGLPFDDPSGDRLRFWMGIDRAAFYDERNVLIAPMGFCFPGHTPDKGDLPPRKECAAAWHDTLFAALPQVELILAIGRYAQSYHFKRLGRPLPPTLRLEELVRSWRDYAGTSPRIFALPHPSWRNSGWLKRNPWFEADVLPELRREVAEKLVSGGAR